MHSKVKIYGKSYCPYCGFAQSFLDQLNVSYEYVDITEDPLLQAQVFERAGGAKTVPQIFVGDFCIGGFTELKAAHERGELMKILESNA